MNSFFPDSTEKKQKTVRERTTVESERAIIVIDNYCRERTCCREGERLSRERTVVEFDFVDRILRTDRISSLSASPLVGLACLDGCSPSQRLPLLRLPEPNVMEHDRPVS